MGVLSYLSTMVTIVTSARDTRIVACRSTRLVHDPLYMIKLHRADQTEPTINLRTILNWNEVGRLLKLRASESCRSRWAMGYAAREIAKPDMIGARLLIHEAMKTNNVESMST